MSYKIIVARYNEDINWLKDEMSNCIIYNKGDKLNIENEIMLKNVGRESDTYLYYIITNYDNLPDILVFTQARISDHVGDDDVNYLLKLKNDALHKKKSQDFIIHYQTDYNCCWDKEWNLRDGQYYLSESYKDNKKILFIDWFKENIISDYPNPNYIYSKALFAVKKELILKNSIEYYKKLILEVNHHSNPVEAHFFERSWYYIFH